MPSVLIVPSYVDCRTQSFTQQASNAARSVGTSRIDTAVVAGKRLGSVCSERIRISSSAWRQRPSSPASHLCQCQAPNSSEATAADNGDEEEEESSMTLSTFEEFVKLNVGTWGGKFYQFDILGRTLQQIPVRLESYSDGKGTNIALHHTLKIKEALSKTSVPGEVDEPTWAELKLNPTNLSTIDRPQQIVYFSAEKAYCTSHQTADVLNKVLRAGVLGEDDDEREESPNGVKLASRRPALVSESCLYSEDGDLRVRVFIVLDPRGVLDVVGYFAEKKMEGAFFEVENILPEGDAALYVDSFVGDWAGPAVTRRTGVYGSTVVESDVGVKYAKLPGGFISQELSSSKGFKVNLTGQIRGSVLDFEGGLQTILLPGGVAVSAPVSVGRSVGRSQSFFFEFSWMQSSRQRQRLVRTYDTDGLVVSTTWSSETKL